MNCRGNSAEEGREKGVSEEHAQQREELKQKTEAQRSLLILLRL